VKDYVSLIEDMTRILAPSARIQLHHQTGSQPQKKFHLLFVIFLFYKYIFLGFADHSKVMYHGNSSQTVLEVAFSLPCAFFCLLWHY